ncbi:hypothetical protein Cs7R123_13080 [Catellatospora sp. TT07R-123]|uniref:hypothetical protein n=1 Tax=Catellatospora sp. TT07R-123 TaxID=2733863 RepID=UPI001B200D5A|nr:hypothetical protein [Catellatospora sp. TT07R-123]GHJ43966.1 hypothetical protein Cs7R123_13080 [Catellatospora sp. TT07R-123]
MNVYDIAAALPPVDVLRRHCLALAALDAVVADGERFTFAQSDGETTARMDDGCGDEYDIVFSSAGVFIRGVYHESSMSAYHQATWPGLLDGLPTAFVPYLLDPRFHSGTKSFVATFVLWRLDGADRWSAGRDIDLSPAEDDEEGADGSWLLRPVCDGVTDWYLDLAQTVYDADPDRAAVECVVELCPLTETMVRALNPAVGLAEVGAALARLGYPGH